MAPGPAAGLASIRDRALLEGRRLLTLGGVLHAAVMTPSSEARQKPGLTWGGASPLPLLLPPPLPLVLLPLPALSLCPQLALPPCWPLLFSRIKHPLSRSLPGSPGLAWSPWPLPSAAACCPGPCLVPSADLRQGQGPQPPPPIQASGPCQSFGRNLCLCVATWAVWNLQRVGVFGIEDPLGNAPLMGPLSLCTGTLTGPMALQSTCRTSRGFSFMSSR